MRNYGQVTEYDHNDGRQAEAPLDITLGGMQMSAPAMTEWSPDWDVWGKGLLDPVAEEVDEYAANERVDHGNNGTSGPLAEPPYNITLEEMQTAAKHF